jgi:hypothetical protein
MTNAAADLMHVQTAKAPQAIFLECCIRAGPTSPTSCGSTRGAGRRYRGDDSQSFGIINKNCAPDQHVSFSCYKQDTRERGNILQ